MASSSSSSSVCVSAGTGTLVIALVALCLGSAMPSWFDLTFVGKIDFLGVDVDCGISSGLFLSNRCHGATCPSAQDFDRFNKIFGTHYTCEGNATAEYLGCDAPSSLSDEQRDTCRRLRGAQAASLIAIACVFVALVTSLYAKNGYGKSVTATLLLTGLASISSFVSWSLIADSDVWRSSEDTCYEIGGVRICQKYAGFGYVCELGGAALSTLASFMYLCLILNDTCHARDARRRRESINTGYTDLAGTV